MSDSLSIYAVIVCFEPSIEHLTELINSLAQQGVSVIVVDNSEVNPLPPHLNNAPFLLHTTHENIGIAAAQNIGIGLAQEEGADVVAFFDQDSSIPEGFIALLVDPIIKQKAVMTAPIYQDTREGFFYPMVRCNSIGWRTRIDVTLYTQSFWTNVTISSGSMVHRSVFDAVGKFDERFFIDHVDTEWFMRAWHKGYNILIIPQAIMQHAIGSKHIEFLGRKLAIHSAERRYYRIRNGLLMLRLAYIPRLLSIREVMSSFIHQMIIVVKSKEKQELCHYYLKALWDGARGKGGKMR